MKRDPARLAADPFDLLVVGGGIYGAFVAWDAALRGLSVALVERDDFGSRTSSNSLKIAHGGLRYLQHADVGRMRQSIRERRALMHVAPHLVHPLRCLLPAYGHGIRGREALAAALWVTDLIGLDRSPPGDPQKALPRSRTLSRRAVRDLLPGLPADGLTGAACWYDCQIYNPDRFVLGVIASAVRRGAVAANYVTVTDLLSEGGRVRGVRAVDTRSGDALEVRAGAVVNCAGPWVADVLSRGGVRLAPPMAWSWAMNLVVPRMAPDFAFAAYAPEAFVNGVAHRRRKPQALFLAPWRDVTLIGTTHHPFHGGPNDFRVTRGLVRDFLAEVNRAYPSARLTVEDVRFWYGGLLPAARVQAAEEDADLLNAYRVIDHGRDGAEGLLSVVGVKFTTARHVAEKVVDAVFRKLGWASPPPSTSASQRLDGAEIDDFEGYVSAAIARHGERVAPADLRRLIMNHGTEYADVLALTPASPGPGNGQRVVPGDILVAAARHAVREEMAVTLADVVRRRTEAGSAGIPDEATRSVLAAAVGQELGWGDARIGKEMSALCSLYALPE
jgi:glycerol-3-phosphate dehydrogenase